MITLSTMKENFKSNEKAIKRLAEVFSGSSDNVVPQLHIAYQDLLDVLTQNMKQTLRVYVFVYLKMDMLSKEKLKKECIEYLSGLVEEGKHEHA